MKRILLTTTLSAVAALLLGNGLHAQAPAACPSTATLDDLVKAIDIIVSGPTDKDRSCMHELMTPGGRLVPVGKNTDGVYEPHPLTPDEWIERIRARGKGVLSEHQVKVTTETFGHVAHLWSTYELRTEPNGPVTVRGVNSIQALYDGKRWRIYQIFWQAETPDEKIPEKYLP